MKELKEYNAIINSPFSQELSNLNYDNIDTEFLENLNEFIDSIMALSPDIQKNNKIIEKLKNSKGKSNNTQITLDNIKRPATTQYTAIILARFQIS